MAIIRTDEFIRCASQTVKGTEEMAVWLGAGTQNTLSLSFLLIRLKMALMSLQVMWGGEMICESTQWQLGHAIVESWIWYGYTGNDALEAGDMNASPDSVYSCKLLTWGVQHNTWNKAEMSWVTGWCGRKQNRTSPQKMET